MSENLFATYCNQAPLDVELQSHRNAIPSQAKLMPCYTLNHLTNFRHEVIVLGTVVFGTALSNLLSVDRTYGEVGKTKARLPVALPN